ncbi:MAG: translation elongation factor-like protein [Patescibacteria group bacterium]|nr:translation elongation factor-like protein [Patescibacteria group bacterium]
MAEEKTGKEVGEILHFFDHISVAVVKATKEKISVGDKILVKGATTNFEQEISSMQIDHAEVKEIKKGEEAGMKVDEKVREGDIVYKI